MTKLKDILRITPFRAGCLVILAACLLFLSFDEKPRLMAALDSRGVDAMFKVRGKIWPTGQVVIVDIDEKSLKELGQWPWPRNTIAELVDRIRIGGAKVVGFDVVFAEQDRTSPALVLDHIGIDLTHPALARQFQQLQQRKAFDFDRQLGDAVSKLPSVLGYIFLLKDDGLKDPTAVPFPSLNIRIDPAETTFEKLSLIPAYRAIINIPEVAQATSEGFFNFIPDATGMVNKAPLFMHLDGIPYPSLVLEMTRIGLNQPEVVLHASKVVINKRNGLLGVSIGEHFIHTDDFGQMTINHRGPVGTFQYLSAVDVLQGTVTSELQDKYVLIGTTSAGLHDLRATPFSNIFPGVEIQASIIDNILAGDPMQHDPVAERGLTLVLIIAGGLLLNAILVYGNPMMGGLCGLLLPAITVVANYHYYFLNNTIVGISYPVAVIMTIFPIVTVFNYFYEGREKRFINSAFSHYVSPKVVEQLKKDPGQLTLSGESKTVTVMFSDIRNFTTISEQLSPQDLGRLMNSYLSAMSKVIQSHHGMVDKFIGDAIMAIWNAPLDDDNHAIHSVRSALDMTNKFLELRPELRRQGFPEFDVGIGINTGDVRVGNFGSEERFDYTVIGDNVNLASRLEGLTKIYGVPIVISEQTKDAAGDTFHYRMLDLVKVKGKDKPVKIYQPLTEGPPESTLRSETEAFEKALLVYFNGDFSSAKKAFDDLCRSNPHPLYTLYAQRAANFLATPPDSGWDGITTMETK